MKTIEQARITYQDYEAYLQAFKDRPFGRLRTGPSAGLS